MDLEAIEALSLMLVTADYLDWIYFELQVLNVSSKSGGALAPVATPVPTPMHCNCRCEPWNKAEKNLAATNRVSPMTTPYQQSDSHSTQHYHHYLYATLVLP